MFKVNDEVRILGKHDGELNKGIVRWKKGDTGYISSITGKEYWLKKTITGSEENGYFYKEDLELVYHKNDKVEILNLKQTNGHPYNDTPWNIGDIAYIHSTGKDWGNNISYVYLKKSEKSEKLIRGAFNAKNLKLLKREGEKEMKKELKYKFVKNFTHQMFLADCVANNCNANMSEISKFTTKLEKLGVYHKSDVVYMTQAFHDYFTQHSCLLNYLLKMGYIKKVEPEIKYPTYGYYPNTGRIVLFKSLRSGTQICNKDRGLGRESNNWDTRWKPITLKELKDKL